MSPQVIVNGLLLGGLYGCVGVGFSLIWGVMNLINVAHGAMIMLGAYVTYWLFELYGIDPFLSIPLSMFVLFLLGYAIQKYVINLVIKRGVVMTLVLTFGLQLLLINLALILWKADYRAVTPSYAGTGFHIGSLVFPYIRLAVLGAALLLTLLLYLFIAKTKMGNAIKATALNKEAAQLVGVNIGRIYAITFGIGAALAGAAGALISAVYTISPIMGQRLIGKSFIVACLGGLGNMAGALIGGLIVGLAETIGGTILGPGYQEAVSFILLVLILVVRPEGILGRKFFGGYS